MKLYQAPNEKVQTFFLRLDETFKRMVETRPAELLNVRVAPLAANQDNARDALIKLEGLRDQDKFFLSQMFLAGLRENIRAKVMEEAPADLIDIVDLAIEKETIYLNEKNNTPTPSLFSIEEKTETEGGEDKLELNKEELEMINAIRKRKNQTPFKRNGNGNSASTTVVCRYCKKTGHWQKQCRTRLRDKAPCVDEHGKPYTQQPKVDGLEGKDGLDFNKISMLGLNHLNY
jgi:hypothetical protein